MSIKKYIQIILAVIGCVFLFTGCMPYRPMEIAVDGLPEGIEICVLLKSDIKPEQPMRVPDALKGTELEGYEFDGWKPFYEYERVYQDYNGKTGFYEVIFQNGASAKDIRAFCEIYQELCLAVTDKNKKIQYVTSVLDLTPSYRFGYPQEVTYDVKTDSFSINKYVSNTIYGKTPVGWLAIVTLFSWLTNAFFISILNKSLKTEDIYYLKKKRLPLVLLAIPGTVAVIMAMVIKFVPYLGGGVELKELPICIAAIMLINMLYVAGMISLTAALHHNKKLRSSQEL